MSREDPQLKLRLTAEMRDEIRDAALANGRSMNAEIVARLSGQQRTLRDWFAGQAIAGVLSRIEGDAASFDEVGRLTAKASYAIADAMLRQREAQP